MKFLLIVFFLDHPPALIEFATQELCEHAAKQISRPQEFRGGAFVKSVPSPVTYCLRRDQ